MDQAFESSNVLTSEALRAAALTASARRGALVARQRIVLRWSAWLLWRWLLPVIGLATVLAALLTLASITFWGSARVFDTSQTWLAAQMGLSPNTVVPSATFPNFSATPGVIPQLQIDRNYSNHDQSNPAVAAASAVTAVPEASIAPATSTFPTPSSPPKPSGAQP